MSVPDWASFLSPEQYRAFRAAVEGDMHERGREYDPDHLDGGVLHTGGDRFGLANLAKQCRDVEPEAFREIIQEHFDTLLSAPAVDADTARFEEISPVLKVRLFPDHIVEATSKIVHRDVSAGVLSVLALDLPDRVVTVNQGQVGRWGKSVDELFELGHANVRAEPRLDVEREELGDGATVLVLTGESFFAASHVFFLDAYLESGEHGALVALPDRHMILAHAIEDARMLSIVGSLVAFTHDRHKDAQGALSPHLHWRTPDGLTRLMCGVRPDGQPWFAPPEAFNDMVARLGAPSAQA